MTKKVLLKLHLWLSLPLGVIIILICLSGATLVFKNEIRNALEMPKVIAPHAKSVKVAYSVKAGDEEMVGKTVGKFFPRMLLMVQRQKEIFSPMSPSFTPVS